MDAPGAAALTGPEAERLRGAGRRVTRPRVAVYRALRDLGGHRSADEVADHLRAGGERLSRTSVYNALDALVGAGLVMAADAGPGRALYEADDGWHHHFVCRGCGAVLDVACLQDRKPCLHAELPGVVIDEAQVIFRGLCEACAPTASTARRR